LFVGEADMKRLTLLLVCLAVQYGSYAQSKLKEMNVDMPDETEETSTLDKGEWQVETAMLLDKYYDGGTSAIGQAMVKYGVSDKLELRLLVEEGRNRTRYMDETVQATYPLSLSAKVKLLEDQPVLPDISLVTYLELPLLAHNRVQKQYWSPIVLLAFKNEFGEKWKLDYNVGLQQEPESTEWVWLGATSLHYKVTEHWEVFGEYFAQYQGGEEPQHNVGLGIAWQLNNHFELYGAAGSSVNYTEYNRFVNAGLAVRL
jgi:hypothetical protein